MTSKKMETTCKSVILVVLPQGAKTVVFAHYRYLRRFLTRKNQKRNGRTTQDVQERDGGNDGEIDMTALVEATCMWLVEALVETTATDMHVLVEATCTVRAGGFLFD